MPVKKIFFPAGQRWPKFISLVRVPIFFISMRTKKDITQGQREEAHEVKMEKFAA
jgi:hypothetical protein